MRAFSATVRFGQSESSWNTQRTPALRSGGGTVVGDVTSAIGADGPGIGSKHAGQHMHQRRLAGAVVADQPQAFAGADAQVDTGQRTDGAEAFSTPSSRRRATSSETIERT